VISSVYCPQTFLLTVFITPFTEAANRYDSVPVLSLYEGRVLMSNSECRLQEFAAATPRRKKYSSRRNRRLCAYFSKRKVLEHTISIFKQLLICTFCMSPTIYCSKCADFEHMLFYSKQAIGVVHHALCTACSFL